MENAKAALKIRSWFDDWNGLFRYMMVLWNCHYGSAKHDLVADEYTFVTGGWSENEDLIKILRENQIAWALFWESSERGGKYKFRCSE